MMCSIRGCTEAVKLQPASQAQYPSSLDQKKQPSDWALLPNQPAPPLTEDMVLAWLLQLREAEVVSLIERVLNERPSLCKAFTRQQNAATEAVSRVTFESAFDVGMVAVGSGTQPEVTAVASHTESQAGKNFELQKIDSSAYFQPNPNAKALVFEDDPPLDLSMSFKPDMPTVQFSTGMFFGEESEGFCEIELMRIGPASEIQQTSAAVLWQTRDGSAKAGQKYRKSSGKAEFQPGDSFISFRIDLINNEGWDPTLDFYVDLQEEGLENVKLHRYHKVCRVKIIDDDAFPTNRFANDLLNGRVDDVPVHLLMMEYFKMNFKNKTVFKGSWKWLCTDSFENVVFLFCLVIRTYMINQVLMPVINGERIWDTGNGILLVLLAVCFFIPQHFMHYLDFRRVHWKVGGASRKLLQANLMRKYMSYSPKALAETDQGLLILVLYKEIPELVSRAYCGCFKLAKDAGLLFLLLVYQTVGVKVMAIMFGTSDVSITLMLLQCALMFVFPLVMFFTLKCREHKGHKLDQARKEAEHASTKFTIDTLNNFFLLADYGKRGAAISDFESKIGAYNNAYNAHHAFVLNNEFVPKSLTHSLVGIWIICGGLLLVNGDMEMGTFLANWSVFKQIGNSWASIYRRLLDIEECFTNIITIVRLMNLPTANDAEKDFTKECNRAGKELAAAMTLGPDDIAPDVVPICVRKLGHNFSIHEEAFSAVSVEFEQGKMHMIGGRRGSGKTTLLKLIGCRIVKPCDSSGSLIVPAHLRVLHISKEPLFFYGSLYDNLTYGVQKGDKDGALERVRHICTELDIRPKTLALIQADGEGPIGRWMDALSRSDCTLLNLARGLVTNPEIMVVHKPSMGLGPNTIPGVFKSLRAQVRERGVLQNRENFFFRRPRTCIFTFNAKGDELYADVVHSPFPAGSHSCSFMHE